jgi:monofunctional biosynthetic peptidoglycan transglycosylase
VWDWVRTHKFRTALILLGLFVVVEAATIPWFAVADLKNENPEQTALMRQRLREAEAAGKKLKITQAWVPLARISPDLIEAVIVAEDGTFRSHGGVDWFEVGESVQKNMREFRAARGASTITQQLAKNLYLSTSKDPLRKAKELVITLLLERQLSKDRILEIYLNVIEWGRGVFGVEAAARTFFGKSAASLTLDEALRLAAVIPSPLRHAPNQESRYVVRRAEIVRRRLEARSSWRARQQPEEPGPSLEFPEELQEENERPRTEPPLPAPAVDTSHTAEPPGPAIDTSLTRGGGGDGL